MVEWCIVVTVLFIIFTGYLNFVMNVVLPWMVGSQALLHFVVFSGVIAMILTNYFMCMFSDPGRVPPQWLPAEEDAHLAKLCAKCHNYKPPRAHHCRESKRCVPRMDHYCVWVQNTVGFRNYKFFYLFLFYIAIGFTYMWTGVIARLVAVFNDQTVLSPLQTIGILLASFICLPVSLMLYGFFGFHTFLTWNNLTTIEHFEIDRLRVRQHTEVEGKTWRHIYDIGVVENFKSVLGSSFWKWFIPTYPTSSGLSFPLCKHAHLHQPSTLGKSDKNSSSRDSDKRDRDRDEKDKLTNDNV